RIHAGATRSERTINAIFNDAIHQHGVDILATQDEVCRSRNSIAVDRRYATHARNGEIADNLQVAERDSHGLHRLGADATTPNTAQCVRVTMRLEIRGRTEIRRS